MCIKKKKIVHTKYKTEKSRIKILKKERKIALNKKENKISKEIKINKKLARRDYSNQTGITLIALVVTIVVLLILAGVSINALFGDSGIINKAKDAQNKMNQAAENDQKGINELSNWLDSKINGNSGGNTTGGNTTGGGDTPTEKPLITDSSLTSNDRTTSESTTVIAKDKKGNQVVVPGGFKISSASGESVQQGIVIEDKDGNQFVWVPVSNKNGDGSNKIVKDDGSEVEITLGRYTFARSSPGTPAIKQKGSEYDQTTLAQATAGTLDTKHKVGSYYELNGSRTSNEKSDTTGTNTTAKNLKEFIEKTESNKGFYIARYEASYGSGYNSSGTDTATKFANAKPLSKVSTANSTSSMNYKEGTLWNFITQPQAALVSQNMYKNDKYVESDLINSYAWDTAIVYIQAMGNSNYANQTDGNGTLKNTGSTEDEKCKIFDMAGNLYELTTEYSTNTTSSRAYPCTSRGGNYYGSGLYTSSRSSGSATISYDFVSFRPLLYVK
jgi:type II secretory pathway pseudopilin PulG